MIGQGAHIFSSIIIRIENQDYLLIKKVIIGDHVVLGGNSIVAPGTIIGKGTTLGVWTVTHINQKLEPNWIYFGSPARKYQPTRNAIEESKKNAMRRIVDTGEKIPYDIDQFKNKNMYFSAFCSNNREYVSHLSGSPGCFLSITNRQFSAPAGIVCLNST
jgi:hypothetical protein